eukprot:SAG11_NODE_13709_length_642_cov_3.425414_1_plen_105_part_00
MSLPLANKNVWISMTLYGGRWACKHVYRLYQGDAKLKKLWKERMELRAAGGDPTTRPELFAQDKYFARYNESGKVKPGYPVPVCVTCGLTWHTAGTHQDRKKSE